MIETHISSLIIQTRPENAEAIRDQINEMDGIDLYYFTGGGKFVVTIEALEEKLLAERIDQINSLDGVMSTSMVYHHCDTPQSLEEEISV